MSDSHEPLLVELRPVAFAIAYRMLGSVAEAEDIVQDALLRLHTALEHEARIESPRAYLSTVTTRLAIDELRSARNRRERYVGEWLPEPILTDPGEDPAGHAEMADSLSLALLVLLESLSPEQRAVLLLRDVFDYGYAEIAAVLGKSEAGVRQLAVRARRHVEARRPRFEASRERREELTDRFFAAIEDGDVDALESLLTRDVVLHGDGGGRVPALARPVHGSRRVARTLMAWRRQIRRALSPPRGIERSGQSGIVISRVELNGQPGALIKMDGRVFAAWVLDLADGQVQSIRSVVNPDKLRHLQGLADADRGRPAAPWHSLSESAKSPLIDGEQKL